VEELELAEPIIIPEVRTSKFRVITLCLELPKPDGSAAALIRIILADNNNKQIQHNYHGIDAEILIQWINTANFSTQSLHKRMLQKLSAEGVLPAGEVTGFPDPPITG